MRRVISLSRLLAATLLAAGTAAPAPAAAPAAPATGLPAEAYLLPPDSVVLVAADVKGFFASKLWAQIGSGQFGAAAGLTPDKSAELAREAQEGMTKGMAEMEAEVGFRADRDLDWVLFGLRNPDAPTPEGVAVLVGRFDAARITAAAEAAQVKKGNTVSKKSVGPVTVFSFEKAGKVDFAMAVPGPQHIVVGDAPMVEAALAARAAGRRPLEANKDLLARLRGAKPAGSLYLLAGGALMQKMGGASPVPPPKNVSLAVAFDGPTELAAEMASAADAQKGASTIQSQLGMIGGMLAADPDPQKGVAGKMLSGLTVKADGAMLRVATAPGGLGLGAVAAIAIPSLMKARTSANESAAIGDLRTVISAEAAYSAANNGLYGEMACLSAPATCVKGYSGPHFLDQELASLAVKSGYKRAFYPGKRGAKARSLQGFAYTAVPAEPGKTGTRSFCGEASGTIRVDPKGGDIKPVGGVCPAALEALK
jgi:hypothetical protein